jgi:hypothetical protein
LTLLNNKFVFSKLEKAVLDETKKLSAKIYNLMPRVNLSDILIDTCKHTTFDKKLIHTSTNKEPKDTERSCIVATLNGTFAIPLV